MRLSRRASVPEIATCSESLGTKISTSLMIVFERLGSPVDSSFDAQSTLRNSPSRKSRSTDILGDAVKQRVNSPKRRSKLIRFIDRSLPPNAHCVTVVRKRLINTCHKTASPEYGNVALVKMLVISTAINRAELPQLTLFPSVGTETRIPSYVMHLACYGGRS